MKIKTKSRDDHQIEITVELENERMENAQQHAARKIAGRVKIPGFRPGKAPYDVIRRHVGDATITEEAIELLVDEIYPEVLKKAKVEAGAAGSLDKVESLQPPTFTFTVPLAPTIDLGDYRSIRIPYEWQSPDEDKLNEAIEELRRLYSTTETVERPASEGDFVLVDIVGNVPAKDDGEKPSIEKNGHPVYVHKDDKENEWPFTGFSRNLIGLSAGESKQFTHQYPNDENNEDIRGKMINFEVNVRTVRGVQLPELNDEFARRVGSFKDLEELQNAVLSNLQQRSKITYEDEYFSRLVDKIREGATMKYPPQLLEHESQHVLESFNHRLQEQGLDMETYLKMGSSSHEKFMDEEVKPIATRRLERSLVLEEIARIEDIKVTREVLDTSLQQTWGELQMSDEFQKSLRGKKPPQKLLDAVTMESASRALTQQTLERLKEIAIGQADLPAKSGEKKKKTNQAGERASAGRKRDQKSSLKKRK